jgi:FkbM family methyltransferase
MTDMGQFYGQHKEDVFINSFFPPEYKGVCVDVGAYDGLACSNTLYFEQRGWRCLCIEPIVEEYQKCCQIRKECVNCCVSDAEKDDQQFNVFYLGENKSAISSLVPDQRLIDSHKDIITGRDSRNVRVRSLTSILDEHNYPTNIDFISIDTENTELDVLKGIDFVKYNITMLVIENNFDEPFCGDYLKQFGYKRINRIAVNDFFVK